MAVPSLRVAELKSPLLEGRSWEAVGICFWGSALLGEELCLGLLLLADRGLELLEMLAVVGQRLLRQFQAARDLGNPVGHSARLCQLGQGVIFLQLGGDELALDGLHGEVVPACLLLLAEQGGEPVDLLVCLASFRLLRWVWGSP